MINIKSFILFFFVLNIQSHNLLGCRYTIRETGFVDLVSEPFYLYYFFKGDSYEKDIETFNEITNSILFNCNIKAEMINTVKQKGHPALQYLQPPNEQSLPTTILVSPEGRSLILPLKGDMASFESSLRFLLSEITSSPLREEIMDEAIKSYGVILLIESENAQENNVYRKIALQVIERIKQRMKTMVKEVDYAPSLVVLPPALFYHEKLLLWSLGLESEITQPYVAVFYGKGRWIGPLMEGEKINESNLLNILQILGFNCECGLDISWVRGTQFPMNWDQDRQKSIAGFLGFDPENPFVKIEVNRILKKGSSSFPGIPIVFSDSAYISLNESDGYVVDKPKSSLRIIIYFLSGMALLIIIIGFIVLYRNKMKTL